nr:M91 family zinc metallopeptidase [Leptospira kmetyi]
MSAKHLKIGDRSVLSNEGALSITSISIDDRLETVYNFEVENAHTYFVTEDSVLVHNKCVIKGRTPKETQEILAMMQKLTRDKLSIDEDGVVKIEQEGDTNNKKSTGTIMIRDLIANLRSTTITMGEGNSDDASVRAKGSWADPVSLDSKEREKAVNKKGMDALVYLDKLDGERQFGLQNKRGKKYKDRVPLEFTLGHELVHALDVNNGTLDQKQNVVLDIYGQVEFLANREIKATGLNYGIWDLYKYPNFYRDATMGKDPLKGNYPLKFTGPSQNEFMKEAGLDYWRYGYGLPSKNY